MKEFIKIALCLAVVGAWGSLLAASPAWASSPTDGDQDNVEVFEDEDVEDTEAMDRAEGHYRMAVEMFSKGRYRESVQEFDQVLAIHDDPIVHCNRAMPLIELGRLSEARLSLTACRDGYPPDSVSHIEVSAEVEALTITLEAVRPTTVAVIDAITASEDDADSSTGDDDGAQQVEPIAAVPASDSSISGLEVVGLVLIGAGAGLGGAAAVVDWQSAELVEEYRRQSQGGDRTSPHRHQELRGQIEMRQRIFWSLVGVGAGAGIAGISTWSWGRFRTPAGDSQVYLGAGADGVQAGWRLQF